MFSADSVILLTKAVWWEACSGVGVVMSRVSLDVSVSVILVGASSFVEQESIARNFSHQPPPPHSHSNLVFSLFFMRTGKMLRRAKTISRSTVSTVMGSMVDVSCCKVVPA